MAINSQDLVDRVASHAKASGHHVIKSLPLGQGFTWCYACNKYLQ